MRITKFLTEDEFNEVMQTMRLTETHTKIAKAALVDRYKLQVIADQFGMSKQSVSQTIRRVWDKFLELQKTPEGWVSIRVSLPQHEAEKVVALEAELKAKPVINTNT